MQTRRIAKNEGVRRHIARDHRTGTDKRKSSNCDPAYNYRTGTNRSPILDQGRRHRPIVRTLEPAIRRYGARKQIIGKTDVGTNKDTIFNSDTLEQRNVILNLDTRSDTHM